MLPRARGILVRSFAKSSKAFKSKPKTVTRAVVTPSSDQNTSVTQFTEAGGVPANPNYQQQQQDFGQRPSTGRLLGEYFTAGIGVALAFTAVGVVAKVLGF